MNAFIKKHKNFINVLVVVFLCFMMVSIVVSKNPQAVFDAFKQANVYWILIIIVLMSVFYLLNSLSLYLLTTCFYKHYTLKQAINNSMIGIFFNGITPMASGGQFYQIYHFKKQNVKMEDASCILLTQFMTYQICLVGFTCAVMFISFHHIYKAYNAFFLSCFVGFTVNISIALMLFIGASSKKTQGYIVGILLKVLRFCHIKNTDDLETRIYEKLDEFHKAFCLMKQNKPVLMMTMMIHLLRLTILYSIPYCCMKAFHLSAGESYFYYLSLTAFIHMISDIVPLPGASGGSEGTFYYLYLPLLAAHTNSVLLLWRFFTYYFGLLAGFAFFLFKNEKGHKNDIKI